VHLGTSIASTATMAEGLLEPGDPFAWSEVRAEASRRFGIRRFRPGQRELIEAAMQGRDALGILPTAAGKSLCYQLPSLFLRGLVVVVSPLLALMRDQAERLEVAGVEGARLDSTVSPAEQRRVESELIAGLHDLVLVTPERLQSPEALVPLRARGVALVVIDEAHCASQWGHDFRPAYLGLRDAIRELGRPAVVALTATAPPELARDIVACLGIDGAAVVQTGIERDNLRFEVRRTVNREEKERALLTLLREEPGAGIVYAATTRRVAEIHAWLRSHGVDAVRYHGQLRGAERAESHRRFMAGEARVVVATNAFGLGVDKPDVRFVAHWNFPESVEAYYQEAGRGGRDGRPARAVLFFRLEDRRIRSAFLGGRHPSRAEARAVLDALRRLTGERARATAPALAEASGLGARRVAVIVAALESMEIVVRRGRSVAFARQPSDDQLERFYCTFEDRQAADRERLEAVMEYGRSVCCRMEFLRDYFGELPGKPCGRCDHCTGTDAVERVAAPRPPRAHELEVFDADVAVFTAGQAVEHAEFGRGEVVVAAGERITVAFASAGERTVHGEFLSAAPTPSGSA
jgi:ATP-dependent DNA helicase RecQ